MTEVLRDFNDFLVVYDTAKSLLIIIDRKNNVIHRISKNEVLKELLGKHANIKFKE